MVSALHVGGTTAPRARPRGRRGRARAARGARRRPSSVTPLGDGPLRLRASPARRAPTCAPSSTTSGAPSAAARTSPRCAAPASGRFTLDDAVALDALLRGPRRRRASLRPAGRDGRAPGRRDRRRRRRGEPRPRSARRRPAGGPASARRRRGVRRGRRARVRRGARRATACCAPSVVVQAGTRGERRLGSSRHGGLRGGRVPRRTRRAAP